MAPRRLSVRHHARMPRTKKPHRMEVFQANMNDADLLLRLANGTRNDRLRRARTEMRSRVGDALRIPAGRQAEIDCVESVDLFIILKPDTRFERADFEDLRPLLRQALVAGCAATETFMNDLVMDHLGQALRSNAPDSPRLQEIPMTVGQWREIETRYKRRGRGLRELVLKDFVAKYAGTSPTKVGGMMSLLGIEKWSKKLDTHRKTPKGSTEQFLTDVTKRRNRIAHSGDRVGQGRAHITSDEVQVALDGLRSVVAATESVVTAHFSATSPKK